MGDLGLIPGLGRYLGGGHGYPLQYSCMEHPHGQRSLVGYRPWVLIELEETEQLYPEHTPELVTHVERAPCKTSMSLY